MPGDLTSRIILGAFAAIMLAAMGWLAWIGRQVEQERIALSRIVLSRHVAGSPHAVEQCLREGFSLKTFRGAPDTPSGHYGYDPVNRIGARLFAEQDRTRAEISTLEGRPLRAAESAILDRCLPSGG